MIRPLVILGAWTAVVAGASLASEPGQGAGRTGAATVIQVFKSPTCGCCKAWIERMRTAGFEVSASDLDDEALAAQKKKHGVLPRLQSCHTALVEGYVLEGHVPADDIRTLLATRPTVKGLAVPQMPRGSPGMEMPDGSSDRYDVVAFTASGTTRTFARH